MTIWSADGDTFDPPQVAVQSADGRLETNFDAEILGNAPPLRELPDPATGDVNGDAALEIALAADRGVLLQRLPLDADLAHPMDGRIRFLAQRMRELAIHAALGHAVEIGHEIVRAIGLDNHGREQRIVDIRDELADFVGPRVHEPKAGSRVAGIAAVFRLGRLFQ